MQQADERRRSALEKVIHHSRARGATHQPAQTVSADRDALLVARRKRPRHGHNRRDSALVMTLYMRPSIVLTHLSDSVPRWVWQTARAVYYVPGLTAPFHANPSWYA